MRYPIAKKPPVQQSRVAAGMLEPPKTVKLIAPMAPPPSRMERRPVVTDQWGHMSLAGNETDRNVVPVPVEGGAGGLPPIACAIGGFLLVSMLTR